MTPDLGPPEEPRMKSFVYHFLDPSGRPEVGTLKADSLASAYASLAREGITDLSIHEAGSPAAGPTSDLPTPPEPEPPRVVPGPAPRPDRPVDPEGEEAVRPVAAFGAVVEAITLALLSPVFVCFLGTVIYQGQEGWSAQGSGFGFFLFGIGSLPIFAVHGIAVACSRIIASRRRGRGAAGAIARVGGVLHPALLLGIVNGIAAAFGLYSPPAIVGLLIALAWPISRMAGPVASSRRR